MKGKMIGTKTVCLMAFAIGFLLQVSGSAFGQMDEIAYFEGAWSPDDTLIALFNTAPARDTIEVFTTTLEPMMTLRLENIENDVTQVNGLELAWSSDSTKLAAVFFATDNAVISETYIVVWEIQTGTEILRLNNSGLFVSWSPSGNYLATGSSVYDATTGEAVQHFDIGVPIYHLLWHPSNEDQVLVGVYDAVVIFEVSSGDIVTRIPCVYATQPVFSPNGDYLALESRYGVVEILETSTYQTFASLPYEGGLSEQTGIHWHGNEAVGLTILGAPIPILNIHTGEVVDTVSVNSFNIWNTQGTKFLARDVTILDQEAILAVFDTSTERVLAQLFSENR